MSSNVWETVANEIEMPFPPYDFQDDVFVQIGDKDRMGIYMEVGTGKTFVSSVIGIYKILMGDSDGIVVIMPPILLLSWKKWLDSIPEVDSVIYRGTPAQRKKIDISDVDVVLVGIQIFKIDYARFVKEFKERNPFIIVDEATSIKNVTTANHKRVRDFSEERGLALLTGTPINSPMDCYGYIKLVAPGVYRNKKHFEFMHVAKRDFFKAVTEWSELDMLHDHMKINSVTVRADDVLDLPETTYAPVHYELSAKHYELYKRVAEERLLELPDGSVLDASEATKLYNVMQQMVMSPQAYSEAVARPAGYDVIDEVLEEMAGEKVIIYSNFRLTNKAVGEYLADRGAVTCYGGNTGKQNSQNIERFMEDPAARILVASSAAGVGLNLQHVCRTILTMEMPITPDGFIQLVGRVRRDGQKRKVLIKIAVAANTVQVGIHKRVLNKDDLINMVTPRKNTMRQMIYGEI